MNTTGIPSSPRSYYEDRLKVVDDELAKLNDRLDALESERRSIALDVRTLRTTRRRLEKVLNGEETNRWTEIENRNREERRGRTPGRNGCYGVGQGDRHVR